MIKWLKRLLEDFKAWLRGEVRVTDAPRGRVYAKKTAASGPVNPPGTVKSRATATCEVVVTRANGTKETHKVPVTVEKAPPGLMKRKKQRNK